jgi:hypothetical protein
VVGAPRAVTGEVNSGRGVGGERGRRLRAAPGLPVVVGKFAGRLARRVGKSDRSSDSDEGERPAGRPINNVRCITKYMLEQGLV